MTERVIEHDGEIYMNVELVIGLMIDRMDSVSMEMTVFGDEWDDEEIHNTRFAIKGYAMATRTLTAEYIQIAPEDRKAVFTENLDRLDDIIASA